MDWFDIIDTVVKMGLGALIVVASLYQILSYKEKLEKNKLKYERKAKLIEQASNDIRIYISALFDFLQALQNAADSEMSSLPEAVKSLKSANALSDSACAKLRLISGLMFVEKIDACNIFEAKMLSSYNKKAPLSSELLGSYNQEFVEVTEDLYEALTEMYSEI